MNSRDYKVFRPGLVHHIYNRGNNKDPIFLDDQDYYIFLDRIRLALGTKPLNRFPLKKQIRINPLPTGAFSIFSYNSMPNHYHFYIRQNMSISTDKLITKVSVSYAKYFNLKYKRVGNIFQDTFKAKLVENDSYAKYLSAYIHNNPQNPITWPYSSFQSYLTGKDDGICDPSFILGMFNNDRESYKKFVLGFSEKDAKNLRPVLFDED